MIEASELVTPTQRRLYEHYRDIHRRFFPSPLPVRSKSVVPLPIPPEQPQPKLPPVPLQQTSLRLKMIRAAVCEFYHVSEETIKSDRRTQNIVMPRHMISYLASKLTKASLPHIGRSLGGQDHTTIMHGIRRMKVRIRNDRRIYEEATRLEATLRQQFGDTTTPRNCIGRYVVHERVEDYFRLGWMWAANLNEYAALMIWPCGCECVEPKE